MSRIEEIVEHIAQIVLLLKKYIKEPSDQLVKQLHEKSEKLEATLRKEVNRG